MVREYVYGLYLPSQARCEDLGNNRASPAMNPMEDVCALQMNPDQNYPDRQQLPRPNQDRDAGAARGRGIFRQTRLHRRARRALR